MLMNLPISNPSIGDSGSRYFRKSHRDHPVVLMVEDQEDERAEMKRVLELNGYRVIDTDNGQDAAKRARFVSPDLVLIDLDVPLLYELVAARQIVKSAQLGSLPIVIVTREESVDPAAMMEVGVRRNEFEADRLPHQTGVGRRWSAEAQG